MTVQRLRLPNGLTVLLEEQHEAPVVALQAWVNVGSADEPQELSGVAHVHEHMLFKGTARRGVGEIARSVEAAGGEINAWTSFDQTVYHVVLAAKQMPLGVDVLTDALRNSSFDATELSRELEVVVEEIRRAQDSPGRRISNALFALAFGEHPYGRPVLGTEATVRALTRERVVGFYKQHYHPGSTTFVAVGDFDSAALLRRIEAELGDWPSGQAWQRPSFTLETATSGPHARILREDVKESRLAAAWPIPGLHHPDVAAIDALAVILGHGESSRLFVQTRRRKELVSDVHAYAYTPRDNGLLMCGAGVRGREVGPALEAIVDEVYKLRDEPVTNEELQKAKVIIGSDAAYQRETVQGQARRLGYFDVVAGDYRFEERYRQSLFALTPDDLLRAAREHLRAPPTLVVQEPETGNTGAETVIGIAAERQRRAPATLLRPPRGAVERIVLDSGAVLLVRSYDAPVVAARAVAYGGLRWESRERAGLGNLFASLWGLSTVSRSTEVLARQVAGLGGSLGAFSSRNTIGLRCDFVAEKAEAGLEVFCEALTKPTFAPEDLDRERDVVLERIRTREDHPTALAFEAFAEAVFPTHPYGLPPSGTEESISAFSVQDLTAYRERFATPDKLVLAVYGGIEPAQAVELFSPHLSAVRGPALPPAPPPESQGAEARREYIPLDKKQAHVVVGSMGTTVFDPERYALEVLTTVLSGQSGRLFLDLRDRQSLAYSVSSSSLEGLDPGYILVHLATGPDKLEQALAGLYGHLDALRQEPITDEELERAQSYLVGTHAIDLQRAGARAMLSAIGERFGLGHDYHLGYAERVRAVTKERVRAAAERFFAPERLVEVVVGPREPRR